MSKETILSPPTNNRERAIVECGRLIDALVEGDGDLVKDCWYSVNKQVRSALAEIRQTELTKPHWADARKTALASAKRQEGHSTMIEPIKCPDCSHAPAEPHTTMHYGGILRVFCERCQRWFSLIEKSERKAA